MPTYPWPVPANKVDKIDDDVIPAVKEYLAAQVQPITVAAVNVQNDPLTLQIDADADPTDALNAWAVGPSQERQRQLAAQQIVKDFHAAIGAAQVPTASQTQRALAALSEIVYRHITGKAP